eukprot:COSAG02_NODE_1654_length_11481_cov_3.465033_3_plen_46_part_00
MNALNEIARLSPACYALASVLARMFLFRGLHEQATQLVTPLRRQL